MRAEPPPPAWLALVIGNSRLHWGLFIGDRWLGSWHTPHLTAVQAAGLQVAGFAPGAWPDLGLPGPGAAPPAWPPTPELWLASVVAPQAALLQTYPGLRPVTTAQVPLGHTYPSLGVDRALNLLGAGVTYGWPVLVVDAGTALTFTAGVDQALLGGAIVPGFTLQLRSLHQATDQLPALPAELTTAPPRWATDTATAMVSGVIHTLLAGLEDFIQAWWQDYPQGQVVLTGGDAPLLLAALSHRPQAGGRPLHHDPDLMFWGLRRCRSSPWSSGAWV